MEKKQNDIYPYRIETVEPLRQLEAGNIYLSLLALGMICKQNEDEQLFELMDGIEKWNQLEIYQKEGMLDLNQSVSTLWNTMVLAKEKLTFPHTSSSYWIDRELKKFEIVSKWLKAENDIDMNQCAITELIKHLPGNSISSTSLQIYEPYLKKDLFILTLMALDRDTEEEEFDIKLLIKNKEKSETR